jgi:hypothetical protein
MRREPASGDSATGKRLRDALLEDRRRTIDSIRRFNPSASTDFLASFKTGALKEYLEHLRHAKHKSVRLSGWLQQRTTRQLSQTVKRRQEAMLQLGRQVQTPLAA